MPDGRDQLEQDSLYLLPALHAICWFLPCSFTLRYSINPTRLASAMEMNHANERAIAASALTPMEDSRNTKAAVVNEYDL